MDNSELLEQAKKHYSSCLDFWTDVYSCADDDWSFVNGESQWDEQDIKERTKNGKSSLVLNQTKPYVNQVINDIKQARMAIRVVPVDDEADVDTAEVRAGVIRNIEKQSRAKTVYGTAAQYAVGAGIGWISVSHDYCDANSFDQEAFIDRIIDYKSIMIDPLFEEVDGSDAEYGFKKECYSPERFKEIYDGFDPNSFDENSTDDEILVVTYYYKKYKKDTLLRVRLNDGSTRDITQTQLDDVLSKADDMGVVFDYEVLLERGIEVPQIMVAVLSGSDVLQEPEEFPSQYIPLIPVIGDEVFIDDERQFHSLIRQGKDAQRMYNYWKSYSTDSIALQPDASWIGAVGSFDTDGDSFADSNRKNIAFLQYDLVYDESGNLVAPPSRSMPAQANQGLMMEANAAREDLRLALGMSASNMGERSNVISGVALRTNQIEGDNATFHFVDNLSSSIAQVGRVLNDMITVLYSEKKIARIIGIDDQERIVPLNQPYIKEGKEVRPVKQGEQGQGQYRFDVGKYDIDVDVGASYSSKRQETADKIIELARARPDVLDIAGDILFEALDLPHAKEIAKRLRANMPPEMLGDDPSAVKLQQASQAIAQLQEQIKNYDAALQDKKKNEEFANMIDLKKVEQDGIKIQIDAQKTAAEIEKMRAETKNFSLEALAQINDSIYGMRERVDDITEAMEIIVQAKELELDQESGEPEQEPQITENVQ